MKIFIQFLFLSFLLLSFQELIAQKLAALPYVSGITYPIDLKNCGDNRLFVAERGGRIRVIDADGKLRPAPFLDITSKISSSEGEEGFLGIAFSPDYKTDGKLYVDYTARISGQLTSIIEEYKVSASDSNIANASSALKILSQPQPFTNHNGGNLMFGKDGYLYINLGDGGSGGDPYRNGQNKKVFLAKILRIDVSNSSASKPYDVPLTNPFYTDTTTGIKKEIWAYGLRNPWKSGVDRITGDLWIADVGQNAVEEIDFQPANDAGGRNYGWNITEGNSCYSPSTGCNKTGITLPIYDYPHPVGFAITGGYVYRSAQSKALFGTYLFGDYVGKWIDGITQTDGKLSGSVIHFITAAKSSGNPISFGEDLYGEQYVIFNGNGTIYKLQDTSYLRRPKSYIMPLEQGGGTILLQGLQGRNLTYQWLKDNQPVPGAFSPDYEPSGIGSYTLEVTNSLGFKDTSDAFIFGSSIDLALFTAQQIPGQLIRLDWETSSELNIAGYTIQRRKDNETVFSNIGFVTSKAIHEFSNEKLDYTFKDSTAFTYNRLFYRLKIQHVDGSFSYSDITYITREAEVNGLLLFPNPASRQISIYLNKFTGPVFMKLFDVTGKEISSEILNQQNKIINLPTANGVYIMQISDLDGKNAFRQKLVVN